MLILLGNWESKRTSKVGVLTPNSERGLKGISGELEFETQRGSLIHPIPPLTDGFKLKQRVNLTNLWSERSWRQDYTGYDSTYRKVENRQKKVYAL